MAKLLKELMPKYEEEEEEEETPRALVLVAESNRPAWMAFSALLYATHATAIVLTLLIVVALVTDAPTDPALALTATALAVGLFTIVWSAAIVLAVRRRGPSILTAVLAGLTTAVLLAAIGPLAATALPDAVVATYPILPIFRAVALALFAVVAFAHVVVALRIAL
jgi:hypothetical protein